MIGRDDVVVEGDLLPTTDVAGRRGLEIDALVDRLTDDVWARALEPRRIAPRPAARPPAIGRLSREMPETLKIMSLAALMTLRCRGDTV